MNGLQIIGHLNFFLCFMCTHYCSKYCMDYGVYKVFHEKEKVFFSPSVSSNTLTVFYAYATLLFITFMKTLNFNFFYAVKPVDCLVISLTELAKHSNIAAIFYWLLWLLVWSSWIFSAAVYPPFDAFCTVNFV